MPKKNVTENRLRKINPFIVSLCLHGVSLYKGSFPLPDRHVLSHSGEREHSDEDRIISSTQG